MSSVLENMMVRIRAESETKKSVEITAYEALVLDGKLFELKQLVDDQRRLIDFLRVDEKAKERAAVVASLRAEAEAEAQTYTVQAAEWARRIDNIADCVERGEHRNEEDT